MRTPVLYSQGRVRSDGAVQDLVKMTLENAIPISHHGYSNKESTAKIEDVVESDFAPGLQVGSYLYFDLAQG